MSTRKTVRLELPLTTNGLGSPMLDVEGLDVVQALRKQLRSEQEAFSKVSKDVAYWKDQYNAAIGREQENLSRAIKAEGLLPKHATFRVQGDCNNPYSVPPIPAGFRYVGWQMPRKGDLFENSPNDFIKATRDFITNCHVIEALPASPALVPPKKSAGALPALPDGYYLVSTTPVPLSEVPAGAYPTWNLCGSWRMKNEGTVADTRKASALHYAAMPRLSRLDMQMLGMSSDERHEQYRKQRGEHQDDATDLKLPEIPEGFRLLHKDARVFNKNHSIKTSYFWIKPGFYRWERGFGTGNISCEPVFVAVPK